MDDYENPRVRALRMPPTAREWIRHYAAQYGGSLDDGARKFAVLNPGWAARIMDNIGSWPSSEPELAALQRVWS